CRERLSINGLMPWSTGMCGNDRPWSAPGIIDQYAGGDTAPGGVNRPEFSPKDSNLDNNHNYFAFYRSKLVVPDIYR
ncbi:MAG: hypothetical protein ABW153_03405, partial [Sedimenticola sp.]